MRIQLTLLNSEKKVVRVGKDTIIIGRSKLCDVVVPHEGMSRQHCKVEYKKEAWYITDLESINGVFINNERIPPGVRTQFKPFLNVSFGYVSNCELSIDATDNQINQKLDIPVFTPNPGKKKLESRPRVKSDIEEKTAKSNQINGMALIVILMALFYMLYGRKPKAPTPKVAPVQNVIEATETF